MGKQKSDIFIGLGVTTLIYECFWEFFNWTISKLIKGLQETWNQKKSAKAKRIHLNRSDAFGRLETNLIDVCRFRKWTDAQETDQNNNFNKNDIFERKNR